VSWTIHSDIEVTQIVRWLNLSQLRPEWRHPQADSKSNINLILLHSNCLADRIAQKIFLKYLSSTNYDHRKFHEQSLS
jgi:hypothetical protein